MKYLNVITILLLLSACAVAPEGQGPLPAGADGPEELLTWIRTHSFEGEPEDIRRAGKRFLAG